MNTNNNDVEILLVEDDARDMELTLRALKKHNLANKLHVARDGAEALEFLFATGQYAGRDANVNPKIVLLDLRLPKVDGVEVLTRIRSENRTKLIPVVVLTSSHEDVDLKRCYALGVNSYIVKPVEFESFVKAIHEIGLYWLLLNKAPLD